MLKVYFFQIIHFTQNQQVSLNIPTGGNVLSISTISGNSPQDLGVSGGSVNVFVINKSKDYIGLTTQIGICTNGVFFHNNSSNKFDYFFESNYSQVTGKIEKVVSTLTTSASKFGELKLQALSNISNPGGSFSDGIYTNTELHNKNTNTWDGALAKVVISGGSVIEVTITAGGAGYVAGEVLDIKGFSGADVT